MKTYCSFVFRDIPFTVHTVGPEAGSFTLSIDHPLLRNLFQNPQQQQNLIDALAWVTTNKHNFILFFGAIGHGSHTRFDSSVLDAFINSPKREDFDSFKEVGR